jgi:hypothetical protein
MSKLFRLFSCLFLFTLVAAGAWAQGIFATLTGVVSDPSQSVVAGAKVMLRDVGSGSARETTTNAEGYYTFASVPVGAYALVVEAQGFKSHKDDEIRLGGGERRNVNVILQVGSAGETVEVTGVQDFTVATVDSGEKSFTLETKELQNFTQVGSNAAEYIKIVPGFGIQNGTQNKSNYNGQTIGINANGDSGSQSPLNNAFSYNGLPTNSLDITADGAHVSDPGCNCDTPVNPNTDFVQEFKVLTSNFSAEEQKGPVVITSVTKSGGSSYHGSAFFSARNHVLNANDWLNNFSKVQQPANSYYYPGFTFSGPVRIPGTGFNKNKDKLFFFTGFEYFHQVLDTGLLRAVVPTANERTGNFSDTELTAEGPKANTLNANNWPAGWGTLVPIPGSNPVRYSCANCQVPSSAIDPNMQALMNLYPMPNATATSASPYNFVEAEIFNQNNRQWTTRADYNISDNTKVFVRYNYQREVQQFPVGLWWRNSDQVPYPTPILGKNKSDSWAGTITHVFSPTMTNETVMAYTFVGFPNVFKNPKQVNRGNVGYGYSGLFNNGVAQIPSFGNFSSDEVGFVFNPGGFEAGGASQGLYANKYMPSVSDTLTKVLRTHTVKAGFFYEWIRNAQPANNFTNGYLEFDPCATAASAKCFSYGNGYADMITGNLGDYQETNFNRINDISYNTYEFFVQDSWKATKRLTVELGMRFTHFTPWVDNENFGYSIFDLSKYNPNCAATPTFCGFQSHAKNSSVPLGGFPTRALFYQPRFGLAYDVFGTGSTVVRGGWGRFYFHSGQFTNGLDASAGVASANISPTTWSSTGSAGCPASPGSGGAPLLAKNLSCVNVAASPASPAGVDPRDNRQPYTDSYSFTIARRLPWSSLMEVAYVGNQSKDLANTSGVGSNINLVPLGAMFTLPGSSTPNPNPATSNPKFYRRLNDPTTGNGYGDLNLATNNLYSNYNALQVTWGRHVGRYVVQANYSLQKALGIVSSTLNPFNLHSNYGVQPTDRRHLFNIAYSVDLGNPIHENKFLGGAVNGWQLSGITQLESGANLTFSGSYSQNTNFNMDVSNVIIPGSVSAQNPGGIAVNNQSILGTNAVQLNPIITCNPTSGLAAHQYINPNCFTAPTKVGQNGPTVLPAIYGPGYFDSDLGVFKNFRTSESTKLQFRIQAYNFLNHPLWSFPDSTNLKLKFDQDSAGNVILDKQSANFGRTTQKQGSRILEFAVKFFF